MTDSVYDAVIVGGGFAGLRCAGRLQEAGVRTLVVEAADGVGGRVRTDPLAGFLPDRGFQVLLTWFGTQVQRWKYLRTYRIAHGLPDTGSRGLTESGRSVRAQPGVYVCGDHQETPSIEGALTSGRRAVEAMLEDLNQPQKELARDR